MDLLHGLFSLYFGDRILCSDTEYHVPKNNDKKELKMICKEAICLLMNKEIAEFVHRNY